MDATREEVWRPIPGYEGHYEVSSIGRVRSLKRSKPLILAPQLNRNKGHYYTVRLSLHGAKTQSVHLLVATAFLGERPEGMLACHNNGDPTDNRVENLRWDTPSANAHDMIQHIGHPHSRRTHCKHGHEFTPENTWIQMPPGVNPIGTRRCRECGRIKNRRRRQMLKGMGS